jgi:hypothetical protein
MGCATIAMIAKRTQGSRGRLKPADIIGGRQGFSSHSGDDIAIDGRDSRQTEAMYARRILPWKDLAKRLFK